MACAASVQAISIALSLPLTTELTRVRGYRVPAWHIHMGALAAVAEFLCLLSVPRGMGEGKGPVRVLLSRGHSEATGHTTAAWKLGEVGCQRQKADTRPRFSVPREGPRKDETTEGFIGLLTPHLPAVCTVHP